MFFSQYGALVVSMADQDKKDEVKPTGSEVKDVLAAAAPKVEGKGTFYKKYSNLLNRFMKA